MAQFLTSMLIALVLFCFLVHATPLNPESLNQRLHPIAPKHPSSGPVASSLKSSGLTNFTTTFLQSEVGVGVGLGVGDFLTQCIALYAKIKKKKASEIDLLKEKAIDIFAAIQTVSDTPDAFTEFDMILAAHGALIAQAYVEQHGKGIPEKTILIEGLGPVGGLLALRSVLFGHKVTVIERNSYFSENQALVVAEATEPIFFDAGEAKVLGWDRPVKGVCKGALQYLYLFLLALFPTKVVVDSYHITAVNLIQAEVMGWKANELISYRWSEEWSRKQIRDWLKTKNIYHQDTAAWAALDAVPADPKAVVVKSAGDIIFTGGGASSSLHWIVPKLKPLWNHGFGTVTGAVFHQVTRSMAMKIMLPLTKELGADPLGTEDEAKKFLKPLKLDDLRNSQPKYVPLKTYFPTLSNQIWFENVLTVNEVKDQWALVQPLLFSALEKTFSATSYIKDDFIFNLDYDLEFYKPVVGKNYWRFKSDQTQISADLLNFLNNLLVNLGGIDALHASNKIGVDVKNVHLSIWSMTTRMVPKDGLIYPLVGDRTKVFFLGDAFHESRFVSGDGLLTHAVEINECPLWDAVHGVADADEPWKTCLWGKGTTYVTNVADWMHA